MDVVDIVKIRIDGGTQARAEINEDKVAEYADAMEAGSKFDPVTVFFDGTEHWLADGFHRYHAANKCKLKAMACDVQKGTKRDAILFAVGANATHGLHRSDADKRKAVLILLNDKEWSKQPQRWVAEHACVSKDYVSRVWREIKPESTIDRSIVKGGDGRTISTANIGKKKPTLSPSDDIPMTGIPSAPEPEPEPEPAKQDKAGEAIEDAELAKVFARYGEIRQLCNQLSAILSTVKKAITDGDPLYGRTNEPQLKAAIGNARRELTINEPYAICPACGGNRPKTCKVCKGTKYATEPEYKRYEASMGITK